MNDFETLIGAAAPQEQMPAGFVEGVMERILHIQQQKQKQILLRNGLLLSITLIIFFFAAGLLITDMLAARTIDFFSLALMNPDMLALRDGWMALIETIPIASLTLALTAASLLGILARTFLRHASHLPTFPLRYAH